MRHAIVALVMAMGSVSCLIGCGKIPTWGELTGGQQPAVATPAPIVNQTAQVPAAPPAPPAPPSSAELIGRFKSLHPQEISDSAMIQLTSLNEGLDEITEINADASSVTNEAFKSIEKLTNLRQLRLNQTRVDNETCQKIALISTLEVLALTDTKVSDVGVAAISGLKNLKHLELMRCFLTENGFSAIGQLPSLEYLMVQQTNMSNQALDLVCNAKTLKYLSMSHNPINDYGLVSLKKLTALEVLHISSTPVTGEGFGYAQKSLKSLLELGIDQCPLNANGVKAISQFKSIERLNLGDTPHLTDEALFMMLSNMKKIKFVNLSKCSSLSGQGLLGLKGNKEIESLYIDQCAGIGDAVVPFLATLKSLKSITVGSTAITPNGIERLRAALPEAKGL